MILITRPLESSQQLIEAFHAFNWDYCWIPMLSIQPCTTAQPPLHSDLIIFISPQAVHHYFKLGHSRPKAQVCAVGPSTATCLTQYGCSNILIPDTTYSMAGLLAHPQLQTLTHQSITLVCGEPYTTTAQDMLVARGADVKVYTVYRRTGPMPSSIEALKRLDTHSLKAITFSSLSTLNYFNEVIQKYELQTFLKCPWIVISTAMYDHYHTQAQCILAENPTPQAIIKALTPILSASN
ncbi:MAG: hypothetical protein CMF51_03095 [Legionellales bacterium]|nr:hypothetical protein [Legionellales bacterium]